MEERQALSAAAWGLVAIVLVLLGVRFLSGGPDPPAAEVVGPGAGKTLPGARSGVGSSVQRAGPYVHVAGAVLRPGLYRVSAGARVAAAVARAGGPTRRADLTGVNLAARLEDGQQIVVPIRGSTAGAGSAGGPAAQIGLGSATVEDLEQLDGIGPTLAQRIVEHRQASGGFTSIDDLAEVEGIGEKRLESLKESLSP